MAVAYLAGANLLVGAAASAIVMILGVAWVSKNSRLSEDTGIGLLFVGMLALGVVIVSRARSFAVDLTAFLFGDVLSATRGDLIWLAAAATVAGHHLRDRVSPVRRPRVRRTQGPHPGPAVPGGRTSPLLALVVLAVVASFRIVGTLLVFGLLVAPSATAALFGRSIGATMAIAVLLGWSATFAGLIVSWNADTAAGATIAGLAVLQFFVAALARSAARRLRPAVLPTPVPVR